MINIATDITRATATAFENGDKVGLYVVTTPNSLAANGNHVDNTCFTYSAGSWSSATPVYWKDQTTKTDFYCYYPYVSEIASIDAYSFVVKADQSSEANYKASDFLWGKTADVAPTEDAVEIKVKHLMSNVIIKLIAGNGFTAEDLASASVVVCGLKNKASIHLATGAVTAIGDATDITPMAEDGQYNVLLVPQSVTDTDLIKVTIGDQTYTLNQSVTLESGGQYNCNVTLERVNQGINIGIDGWTYKSDFGGTAQ